MVYRFTIISDEVDDFIREIQIDSEATFYELHEAILKAAKYNNDQMTSFFTCDEDWEKEQEITLEDMGTSSDKVIYFVRDDCKSINHIFCYLMMPRLESSMKETMYSISGVIGISSRTCFNASLIALSTKVVRT